MHVLPLPFGLALALLPRREARLRRIDDERPTRVNRRPRPRERIMADPHGAAYRRQFL
jgi:hypothetical protein